MIDKYLVRMCNIPLKILSRKCIALRITANHITVTNIPVAIIIFICIVQQWFFFAVVFSVINRIFDGLDGAIARESNTSNVASGYLDIMVDYLYYASVPLGFALSQPTTNAMPAVFILFGYTLAGVNFMASAAASSTLDMKKISFPNKALFYASNIIEGTETILYSMIICIFPACFPIISYVMATLLIPSTMLLVLIRWSKFNKHNTINHL